jgi:hypothetical protein
MRALMNKVRLSLILLTIAITITPITVVILQHQDNLLEIVLPPEIVDPPTKDTIDGNNSNSSSDGFLQDLDKAAPRLIGEPKFDPKTNTITIDFEVTNPLKTPITLNIIDGAIASHEDGTILANVVIDKPLTIDPAKTAEITAVAQLTDGAKEYLRTHVNSQNEINIDFQNLKLNVAGINIEIGKQNIGNITVPAELLV